MITHFATAVDKTAETLTLATSFTQVELQKRMAEKLGAKQTSFKKDTVYVYKPDATPPTDGSGYGWVLENTPAGGALATATLGTPKSNTDALANADAANLLDPKISIFDLKK